MTPDETLAKLGLTLPSIPTPVANYVPFRRDGNTIYISGQGPKKPDGKPYVGKVGKDFTVEEAYKHARIIGLQILAIAKLASGDLGKVEVIKLLGHGQRRAGVRRSAER